jgi:hypothetical protein
VPPHPILAPTIFYFLQFCLQEQNLHLQFFQFCSYRILLSCCCQDSSHNSVMAAASCALSSSAPGVRSATLLSGNQVDALDRYNSSRRVHSTSTSLIRTAAHGRTQLPIRISTTTVQGLHERRSWKLVRPSAIAVGPRDNNNWVEKEWNSLTQVAPSSPSSPSQRSTKGWTDGNGVEDPRVVAQLRNIAFAAKDRSEMHAIIGVQRDN